MRWKRIMTMVLVAVGLLVVASDTFAIIGRPVTPMSYAGVARRTVRRGFY